MGFKWPSVYTNNEYTALELCAAYLFLLKFAGISSNPRRNALFPPPLACTCNACYPNIFEKIRRNYCSRSNIELHCMSREFGRPRFKVIKQAMFALKELSIISLKQNSVLSFPFHSQTKAEGHGNKRSPKYQQFKICITSRCRWLEKLHFERKMYTAAVGKAFKFWLFSFFLFQNQDTKP